MHVETANDRIADLRTAIAAIDDHEDLHRLFDTLMTIGDVLNGLGQHPRFWRDRSREFTPAGKVIEKLTEAVDSLIDDTAKHAAALPAATKFDRDMKGLTLAAWEVFCASAPVEIIATLAPLAAEMH